MLLADSSTRILDGLPRALRGGLTLRIVAPDGRVVRRIGTRDGSRLRAREGRVRLEVPPGRAVFERALPDGFKVIASFDRRQRAALSAFLGTFFDMLVENGAAEQDMESINSSSLALLEEVSMIGDTLPKLPTCKTAVEVAEMGLEALVLAASLNRALYVQYHEASDHCEVQVQVGMDASGRHAVKLPYGSKTILPPGASIVWEAMRGSGDAILRVVPEGTRLGVPGSPESLAEREIIAVPVAYGSDDERVVLGALLIMDKRPNVYSSSQHLGSQETKFATAVASMLGSVLGTRKVAEFDKEFGLANELQRQILPDRPAAVAGYDLAGRCANSGAVGGDYFDFMPMADGRTMAVVADVSGHNLASGMLMVSARSMLRALAAKHADLAGLFDDLGRGLYDDLNRTERFITAVAAAIRPGCREIELVNAGHHDAIVYRRATGAVERIRSGATVLGFSPGTRHRGERTALERGDVLLLYTDGVVEATDAAGAMLGEEPLTEALRAGAAGSAEQILGDVFALVESFSSKAARGDDVTAVVIKGH